MTEEKRRDVKMATNCNAAGRPECPDCGCPQSQVINTYNLADGRKRRRRACDHCQNVFYTLQEAEAVE